MSMFYLSGGITGLTDEEAYEWRDWFEKKLKDLGDTVRVFNPIRHFNLSDVEDGLVTDETVMDLELYRLRNSDFVIVNCLAPHSIGTNIEIGIALERRIPILALNEKNVPLHPWLQIAPLATFDNREDMLAFIDKHYVH